MYSSDWGFNEPSRRRPGLLALILCGLLGVLLGAALLYVLFVNYGFPASPEQLPDQHGGNKTEDPVLPPPHRDDLAAVEVVERVMPAVVGVHSYVRVTRFGQEAVVESGSGSGAVITADGYIVTNQHVVDGAVEIKVVFADGDNYEARLVGEDRRTDLAVLKIEREDLPYVPLGDSGGIRVGETVLAIGNPLGYFQQTVTSGIISAVQRQVYVQGSDYSYTYIQTDAGINRGNSGGPLVNLRGEVIGINTLKVSLPDVEGIGFAIPSNTVQRVAADLIEYGRMRRPKMGIGVKDYSAVTGDAAERGVYIATVDPGSAAERDGLRSGDVIVAVDEKEINYMAQLFDALLDYYPGDRVPMTVLRNGEKVNLAVVPGEEQS